MQLGAPDVMAAGIGRDFRMSVGDRVFFADRSAELSGRARAAIEAQAHWLKRKSGLIIMVEGHADGSSVLATTTWPCRANAPMPCANG